MVIFSAIIHSVDWGILTMGKKIKKQSSPSEMSEVSKGISMILQIGISMIVPVGLCLFLGYKLDTWLNKSCFMIIFMILGFLAGIRSVYSITKSFYAKDLKKEKENQKYFSDLYSEHEKKSGGGQDPHK